MKLPEIKGFVDLSLVDWDGKISSVTFLPHCNFRCPFCYNSTLVLEPDGMKTIPYEEVRQYLAESRSWLDGVVITGGEPTIHNELPALCEGIKGLDLLIKLDTNGTNPQMTQRLVEQELVDYVAMDVKAPLTQEKYSYAAGVDPARLLTKVKRTVAILLGSSVDYEFRTTLIPTIHTVDDVKEICNRLRGCRKYILQGFKEDVKTLDPRFQNLKPFSLTEMERFLKSARQVVPNSHLR